MDFNSLRKKIESKNVSVKELVYDFFLKIDSKDPEINSYICTTKDSALSQAESIDKLIQNDEVLPPLAGIPIAIKDNINISIIFSKIKLKVVFLMTFINAYQLCKKSH